MVLVEFKDTEAERQFWLFISACNYKARLYGTGPSWLLTKWPTKVSDHILIRPQITDAVSSRHFINGCSYFSVLESGSKPVWPDFVKTLFLSKFVFCRTGLPLARTRWVRSTFSSHCPLSSNQRRWLASATWIIFPLKILGGMLGIEPWAAGWEASMLPLCYAATLPV